MSRLSAAARAFSFAVVLSGVVLTAASNSRLTGRVVDPSLRPVPGAVVVLRSLETLVERSTPTNHDGVYDFGALPVGAWRLQVTAPGFRPSSSKA